MKKKIVEVTTDSNIGGAGKCLIALLDHFDYDRLDVTVILPVGSKLIPYVRRSGVRVLEVRDIAEKSLGIGSINSLRAIFKEIGADLVHTHASMSARIAARLAGAKVVYTRHSVFPPPKYLTTFPCRQLNGAVNNYFADGIIAVADAAKDNLTQTGVSPSKIRVILNGVDSLPEFTEAEREENRAAFGVKDGEKVISIVARLEEVKGHSHFIEAAKILLDKGNDNLKFFIAGTGSVETSLKETVKRMRLEDKVIFTGFISDVAKLMSITDIQVNASYGTEATSLALLEGMSIGIPAVVSDFGGNPGVIKDGVNGYVVPKQNSAALAMGIEKLLKNEDVYAEMTRQSRQVFKTTFTADIMTRSTENYYFELMR